MQLLTQLHDFFRSFDSDASGQLTLDEFRELYANLLSYGFSLSQDVEEALTRLDAGGNGTIDFNELVHWMISVGAFSL